MRACWSGCRSDCSGGAGPAGRSSDCPWVSFHRVWCINPFVSSGRTGWVVRRQGRPDSSVCVTAFGCGLHITGCGFGRRVDGVWVVRLVRVARGAVGVRGSSSCRAGVVVFIHDASCVASSSRWCVLRDVSVADAAAVQVLAAECRGANGYGSRSLNPTGGARVKQNEQVRGGASRRRAEKAQGRKVPGVVSPG